LAARSEEFSPVRCLIPFEIPALREDKTDGRHSNQEHILFLLFVRCTSFLMRGEVRLDLHKDGHAEE
jgi:hypothetical protein